MRISSYRAPELLFAPPTYSAPAIDRWSLGVLLSEFFTPLVFSYLDGGAFSPTNSITSSALGDDDAADSTPKRGWTDAFETGEHLKSGEEGEGPSRSDYFETKTWVRRKLFDAERGDVGLAGSIFKVRGSPNDESWPVSLARSNLCTSHLPSARTDRTDPLRFATLQEFPLLPDALKLPFPSNPLPHALHSFLPNLSHPTLPPPISSPQSPHSPTHPSHTHPDPNPTFQANLHLPTSHPLLPGRTITPSTANPTLPSLLAALLTLDPKERASAAATARHPFFCAQEGGVLLPRGREDPRVEGVRGVWEWDAGQGLEEKRRKMGLRELIQGWVEGAVDVLDHQ